MPNEHMDRLSAIDASFLAQERRASHMHIGAILVFEGPPPPGEELVEQVEARLHLVPRYRQKLAFPPFALGRPLWVDDPRFNIEYHVRHTALPSPGSVDQLRRLAGRIFSQRLDRSKPLWEMWVVQGLAGADPGSPHWALITKAHHAMIDGVSGVDLASVLLDLEPVPEPRGGRPEPWEPRPEPSAAELAAEGVKGLVRRPLGLAGAALSAVTRPGEALREAREAVEALAEVARAGLDPAPSTPLNVEIGPHRRVWWVESRLADFKAIKDALGGTVNDVVLAVVAGALRRWLQLRGEPTEALELRALVPVSIRGEHERGSLGNRIAAMRGPLPVHCADPVERLALVREAMAHLKESKQALGAEVIAGLQDFAPPTLLAQASRLNFSTRLFNLIVTNVPGPQLPLYMLGRELRELIPIAFLPEHHALAVAIMSYNGGVVFGLLGDYDALPDIDRLAGFLDESIAELRDAATARRGRRGGGARRGRRPRASRAAG